MCLFTVAGLAGAFDSPVALARRRLGIAGHGCCGDGIVGGGFVVFAAILSAVVWRCEDLRCGSEF